jgi:hypothetical protein
MRDIPLDSFDAHIITYEGIHFSGEDHVPLYQGSLDSEIEVARVEGPCIVIVANSTGLDELGDPADKETEHARYLLDDVDDIMQATKKLVDNGWNPDGCTIQPMWSGGTTPGHYVIIDIKEGQPTGAVNMFSRGF